mmetsp:Transcript_37758/g.52434  ORF Transcript_37758/g.52434 Transcript_37758/m.52434 type:complete len:218 (+) Transcript_37758:157-810(+)|eukprot:CAMPEP_0196596104 /NCGR_PEP_ID=MMETSP1081-20130531/84221_1 /TAXON_ID=36882 /ORGANISM="Pyramimonas amylifera, Strain CCMP720" /LENGTH=217 /DNA_ID=CAMNT_0041920963 /DNA_START=140 /DNA_END=793 /DNA_ORIENTATION=-
MTDKTLPIEVSRELDMFEGSFNSIETSLEPLLSAQTRRLASQLKPLERAQMHVTLAYAASALFTMYLKTQGVPLNDHPVNSELERVQRYIKKVERAIDGESGARPLSVDVDATNRFITHAIPDLTPDQRKKLKELNKRERNEDKEVSKTKISVRHEKVSAKAIANAFLEGLVEEDSDMVAKSPMHEKRKLEDATKESETPKEKKSKKKTSEMIPYEL